MSRVVLRLVWRCLVMLPTLLLALGLPLGIGPAAAVKAAAADPGAAALTCGTGWQIIPSPNVGGGLSSIVPIPGTTQLWAVGGTVIERWNGSFWRVVPTPTLVKSYLLAVASDAPNDAWAVGLDDASTSGSFILHWDGTAWHRMSSPITFSEDLMSVAAISPTDAWAVGNGYTNQPLIEHWNGRTWHVVAGASTTAGDLYAVARIPGTAEVVAAGHYSPAGTFLVEPFFELWNGHKWTIMPSPNSSGPGTAGDIVEAVRAISPTNIWAAGRTETQQALIEHWDGARWTIVPSATVTVQGTPVDESFYGITTVTGNDIWAVGVSNQDTIPGGSGSNTLVQQWNGATWSVVTTPPVFLGFLAAVAHIPGTTQVWAVGNTDGGNLIEARC